MLSDQYAAGIIDGEGSITIHRRQPYAKSGQKSMAHALMVTVQMGCPEIIQALHDTYGGSVGHAPRYGKERQHHRPMYRWTIQSYAAAEFLERIYPYLIEKKDQAWLGMEFQAQRTLQHAGMGARTSPEEMALRDGFYWALRGCKEPNYEVRELVAS